MSTSKSWDVTLHDALAPYPWSGGVNWYLAKETEISAALWALWLGKDFTFTCNRKKLIVRG